MTVQTFDDPYVGVAAVTLDAVAPSKSAINGYGGRPRGLVVGVAGNINATFRDGSTAVIPVAAGIHRLALDSIATASTTATGLWFLY